MREGDIGGQLVGGPGNTGLACLVLRPAND